MFSRISPEFRLVLAMFHANRGNAAKAREHFDAVPQCILDRYSFSKAFSGRILILEGKNEEARSIFEASADSSSGEGVDEEYIHAYCQVFCTSFSDIEESHVWKRKAESLEPTARMKRYLPLSRAV
ncbi:MAG: hypothetical protein JJ901_13970 [Erythrobacter sp.]|uniref:hypothetical protein n=1 Tax=Erythrobacter sp. TaxID=1042 RepID=UPI001B05B022|nr:hypothetical protein [Erythrobacter sp.]MBO6769393.1 hypothetical protein [Erythrobacter sp.]